MLCLYAVRRKRGRDHRIQETRHGITAETKEAEPEGRVSECMAGFFDGTIDCATGLRVFPFPFHVKA